MGDEGMTEVDDSDEERVDVQLFFRLDTKFPRTANSRLSAAALTAPRH